jgi:hypothetical protein
MLGTRDHPGRAQWRNVGAMRARRRREADVTPDSEDLGGTCFSFGDLPASSFSKAGGAFRPVGLASLQPARKRFPKKAGGAPVACLLPEVPHAHVHTIALDVAPMEQASAGLNWPAELKALAEDPENTSVVARFQGCLGRYGNGRPSVDIRLVPSHGLVRRNGHRLPVSHTYEHIRTTLPLTIYLRDSAKLVGAFGRCLANPERHQGNFLLACVEEAGLAEPEAMLASLPPEERARTAEALYGHVSLDTQQEIIIALSIQAT